MAENLYKLNCTLEGHTLDVRALATFNNGTVVSASRDKSARVWTPNATGTGYTMTSVLMGHTNFVSSVCAINPTEAYPKGLVITGSNDNHICVYVLGETEPAKKFKAHENTVCNLRASHTAGAFISSSWDMTAKIWDLARLSTPRASLIGHTLAVWCAADLPTGILLTGSADKLVIVWSSDATVLHKLEGHKDCVRDIATINDVEFLTCANDATVRHWDSVHGTCLGEYCGHEHYIYSIASLPGGSLVVTASEDRTLRVWRQGNVVAVIGVPAQSIWCVALLSNGDIVAGASDAYIRVFTSNPERYADPATLQAFEEQVAQDQLEAQKKSGANAKDLPGAEALENPGQKDGQVLMIKQDGKAKAYQWSMSEHRWILVGDIVGDNTTPGRQLYKGVEYDYVFSIDIQDGVPPLKLPYNITEDAWVVAQTFIHKNNLSQMYLEQVANFIIKNSQSVPAMKSDSNYTDPFTGASRYVPGSTSRNASRTSTETVPTANVASSSGTSVNSYIPHADYLRQEQGNLPEKIFQKLKELNEKREEASRVSVEELEAAVSLVGNENAGSDSNAVRALLKLLDWPESIVFPALDVARLAVLRKSANDNICTDEIFNIACRHLKCRSIEANQMLTFRFLANMFAHERGELLGLLHKDVVLKALIELQSLGNKNNQIAISTYLLNMIIALNRRNVTLVGKTRTLEVLSTILPQFTEPEAVFRMLVALGTLIAATTNPQDKKDLIRLVQQSDTALQILKTKAESTNSSESKLANCSKQIIDLIT